MGQFSICCKGCGHEINMHEHSRIGGYTSNYDGYGGPFDAEVTEQAGWHTYCYDRATSEQKLNDDASKYAQDQGLGNVRLAFLGGFNPAAPVTLSCIIFAGWFEDKGDDWKQHQFKYILTPQGLLDQQEWEDKKEALGPEMQEALPIPKDAVKEWSDADWDAHAAKQQTWIEERLGKSPEDQEVKVTIGDLPASAMPSAVGGAAQKLLERMVEESKKPGAMNPNINEPVEWHVWGLQEGVGNGLVLERYKDEIKFSHLGLHLSLREKNPELVEMSCS